MEKYISRFLRERTLHVLPRAHDMDSGIQSVCFTLNILYGPLYITNRCCMTVGINTLHYMGLKLRTT